MKKLIISIVFVLVTNCSLYGMEYVNKFSQACDKTFKESFPLVSASMLAVGYHNFDFKNTQLKHALLAGWAGALLQNCFFKDSAKREGTARKINKFCNRALETAMAVTWLYYEIKQNKSNYITLPIIGVASYVGIKMLDVFND